MEGVDLQQQQQQQQKQTHQTLQGSFHNSRLLLLGQIF
jgi:hypothetical protein